MKTNECYVSMLCKLMVILVLVIGGLASNRETSDSRRLQLKKAKPGYRWSAWSPYTPCSRSCGLGIKFRLRNCYKLGKNTIKVASNLCHGEFKHFDTCNTQSCPEGAIDFRSLQCFFINKQKISGQLRNRTTSTVSSCTTICPVFNSSGATVVKYSANVVDGTRCGEHNTSVCVIGNCMPVGCDNKLKSIKVNDKCGVCGGNNGNCGNISGRVRRYVKKGYTELIVLPKYARNIMVSEKLKSNVFLAMKDREGIFFISENIDRNDSMVTRNVAGTVFKYIKNNQSGNFIETIKANGPINETITIMGFSKQDNATVALWYSYTASRTHGSIGKTSKTVITTEHFYPWKTLLHNNILGRLRSNSSYSKSQISINSKNVIPKFHKSSSVKPKNQIWIKSSDVKSKIRKHHNSASASAISSKDQNRARNFQQNQQKKIVGLLAKYSSSPFQLTTVSPLDRNLQQAKRNAKLTRVSTKKNINPRKKQSRRWKQKNKKSNQRRDRTEGQSHQPITTTGTLTFSPRSRDQSARRIFRKKKPVFITDTSTTRVTRQQSRLSERRKQRREKTKSIGELTIKLATTKTEPESLDKFNLKNHWTSKPAIVKFEWRENTISPCSSTCEPGIRVSFFFCYRVSDDQSVDDVYCDVDDKPNVAHHVCSANICSPRWVSGEWGPCSLTCGEGVQLRQVNCWQILAPGFDSSVHDYLCPNNTKPVNIRKCNAILPCGPVWAMSEWGKCSVDCGYGWQVRHVRCSDQNVAACNARQPIEKQVCIQKPCSNYWYAAVWSECSGSCGIKHRKIFCRDKRGLVIDEGQCDFTKKPLTVHGCGTGRCEPAWVPQEWRQCPVSCGDGNSTRKIVCGSVQHGIFKEERNRYCQKHLRPKHITKCSTKPCEPIWYITEWGQCSKPCGDDAVRMREVKCYHANNISENCFIESQPENVETCTLPTCPSNNEKLCTDDGRTDCNFRFKVTFCEREYYRNACCETCRRYGF